MLKASCQFAYTPVPKGTARSAYFEADYMCCEFRERQFQVRKGLQT